TGIARLQGICVRTGLTGRLIPFGDVRQVIWGGVDDDRLAVDRTGFEPVGQLAGQGRSVTGYQQYGQVTGLVGVLRLPGRVEVPSRGHERNSLPRRRICGLRVALAHGVYVEAVEAATESPRAYGYLRPTSRSGPHRDQGHGGAVLVAHHRVL